MASQAQILANEANAQHSTGPKTAEGKVRASKNAQTQGLATGIFTIPDEDREAFGEFEANLTADLCPKGALELETCRQLARAAWNLQRLRRLACERTGDDAAAQLRQLTRYRAAREPQIHEPENNLYPPHIEPRFYAALDTHGDRRLILEIRGFLGPYITPKVVPVEGQSPPVE